jgi:squalene synthase HpnC
MSAAVETPSGKGAADENFPVGSWLLPAHLRPHIALYYAYARAIDDIADNPELPPDEKIRRLDGFARVITDAPSGDPQDGDRQDGAPHDSSGAADPAYATASAIRNSLHETGVSPRHCLDLITAFKQDAFKSRYESWDELIGYCLNSAAPVGRYLIDLHGEPKEAHGPSDALCNALQIINHLQDCADDFREIDRVYIPEDWLREAGSTVADLTATAASPALRSVLDRCLDEVDELMREASALPRHISSFRFAMECAVIIRIAQTLSADLRQRDPLATRVALSKPRYLWCGVTAILALSGRRIFQ